MRGRDILVASLFVLILLLNIWGQKYNGIIVPVLCIFGSFMLGFIYGDKGKGDL
jgi:hypothetical protein